MALQVQPTPSLSGDAAIEFLKKLAEGESRPAKKVETPRIHLLFERAHAIAATKRGKK